MYDYGLNYIILKGILRLKTEYFNKFLIIEDLSKYVDAYFYKEIRKFIIIF